MKILGTGLSGLVGSRIVELLKDKYEFDLSEVDITDRNAIIEKIKSSDAPIVLHLAAKTSVDGCEKDREEDLRTFCHPEFISGSKKMLNQVQHDRQERFWTSQNDEGGMGKKTAWEVNVIGTKNIVDACGESKKKIIYISTDFIFDGSRPSAGGYKEEDMPNPINWYGKTKYEGEEIVKNSSISWIIARIAYPYRAKFSKNDFFRSILQRLQKGEKVMAVTDHIFTPTFIDDIAFAIGRLIEEKATGIFHVVGATYLTPYDSALAIATRFNYNQSFVTKTSRAEFFKSRAPRPFRLALKNDKIRRLGVEMRGFEEGLEELKRQMTNEFLNFEIGN